MKRLKKLLPPLSAAMCMICMALILLDALKPDWSLFLKPAVKWYVLACCASVFAASAILISNQRRRVRRRLKKQAK